MLRKHKEDNDPQNMQDGSNIQRVIPATQAGQAQQKSQADLYSRDVEAYHEVVTKRKVSRIAFIILCTILALLLACGVAFGAYMALISNKLNQGNKSDGEMSAIAEALTSTEGLDKPFYMLLLGSDARLTDTQSRSDTNILVRVDAEQGLISMISIPRDTKIEIKGHGTQKFNAAYAFDGVPGVIKATEKLLDIEVSHYAEVDFRSLAALVDAVGGVTVDVATKIDDYHCDDGDGNHYVIQKGIQHLNGGQALTFARSRHYADGDFTRSSNQRLLVEAIIDQVLSMPLTQLPQVLGAAADCVTTDFSVTDILTLAQLFSKDKDLTIYSAMLPSYTQNINGISFVINDEEKTKEMMKLFEAGEDPSGIVSTKTAPDINSGSIDTSNTLLFDDDDEVANGSLQPTTGGTSGSGGTSQNGSGSGTSNNGSGTTSGGSGNSGSGGNSNSGGSGSGGTGSGSGDTGSGGSGSSNGSTGGSDTSTGSGGSGGNDSSSGA